jgi:hypothetical protein
MRSLDAAGAVDVLAEFLVIVPPGEVAETRELLAPWAHLHIAVHDEEVLIPGLATYAGVDGWRKQQAIKLAGAGASATPFVLMLDPDVICVKPLRFEDLVIDGHALLDQYTRTTRVHWWRTSARLLGVAPDLERPGMHVTPALLSAEVVRGLLESLEHRWNRPWIDVLLADHLGWWRQFWPPALRRQSWSEYSLYYVYAEAQGLLDRVHVSSQSPGVPRRLISQASVWRATPFEDWDPAYCFSTADPGLFCVVQSNKLIPPEQVWERVAPYIERLSASACREEGLR